jgi:hypothetical protein
LSLSVSPKGSVRDHQCGRKVFGVSPKPQRESYECCIGKPVRSRRIPSFTGSWSSHTARAWMQEHRRKKERAEIFGLGLSQTMRMCGPSRFVYQVRLYQLTLVSSTVDGCFTARLFRKTTGRCVPGYTHLDGGQHERGQRRRWRADIRLNRKSLGNGRVFDPATRATSFGSKHDAMSVSRLTVQAHQDT